MEASRTERRQGIAGPRRGAFDLVEPPPDSPLATPRAVLRLLRRIERVIEPGQGLCRSLSAVLEALCAAGDWAAAHVAVLDPDAAAEGTWHVPEGSEGLAALRDAAGDVLRGSESPGGDSERRSLPVDTRSTAVAGPVGSVLPPDRASAAREAGLTGILAFPVRAQGRPVVRVELFSRRAEAPSSSVLRAVDLVRRRLDDVAGRERAGRAVRDAAEHCRRLGARLETAVVRVRDLEERHALLCRGTAEGRWEWDLASDEVFFSSRWKEIVGGPDAGVEGHPKEWLERIHPDDRERVQAALDALREGAAAEIEVAHRLRADDGEWRDVVIRGAASRDAHGSVRRVGGSLVEAGPAGATPGEAASGLRDPDTGLPTPELFLDRAAQTIGRRMRQPERRFAALALHLDGHADVRESEGDDIAREVLQVLARRVSVVIRPGDTLAHGAAEDEFHVLLDDISGLEDALRIARRILSAVEQPFPAAGDDDALRPRLGLVLGGPSYDRPEDLIRDAGVAVSRARRLACDLQVFDAALGRHAEAFAQLGPSLRKAFRERRLHLEYQPIVSLSDGRLTGLEALLRWEHPERGLVPPAEFLPVAREAGLLDEIGYWALRRACDQVREWDEHVRGFPPAIAVNVSGSQLRDEDFVDRVADAVESAGLDCSRLRLDIHESDLTRDGERAERTLEALVSRGVQIAIDDFGAGYSSLGLLHRFPVRTLKIDREFVSGSRGAGDGWRVARSIVSLASTLGLDMIAEGIEDREQLRELRDLGCPQGQGFYFSPPVGPEEAARLIRDGYPLEREDAPR